MVAEVPGALAAFIAAHGVDGVHPRVFVPELAEPALLEVELQGIRFAMGLTCSLLWLAGLVLWGYRLELTPVLEFWGQFVAVEVALGVDDGVLLVEVVGTFLADAVGVVREGPDAGGGGAALSLCDKAKQAGLVHAAANKIKCIYSPGMTIG